MAAAGIRRAEAAARRGRAAVRLTGGHLAHQLPAAGARRPDPREAPCRVAGDAGAGAGRVGRAAGVQHGREYEGSSTPRSRRGRPRSERATGRCRGGRGCCRAGGGAAGTLAPEQRATIAPSTDTGSVTVERSAAGATGPVATPVSVAPTAPTDAPRSRGKGVPTAVAASALPAASLHPDMPAGSGPRTAPVRRGGGGRDRPGRHRGRRSGARPGGPRRGRGGLSASAFRHQPSSPPGRRRSRAGLPMTITGGHRRPQEPDTEHGVDARRGHRRPRRGDGPRKRPPGSTSNCRRRPARSVSAIWTRRARTPSRGGSIVSTSNGVRYPDLTPRDVHGRRSLARGFHHWCGLSEFRVKVTAVEAGPDGNVEANAITVIPHSEEPTLLKVDESRLDPGREARGVPTGHPEGRRWRDRDPDRGVVDPTSGRNWQHPGIVSGAATVFAETADLPKTDIRRRPGRPRRAGGRVLRAWRIAGVTVTAINEEPRRGHRGGTVNIERRRRLRTGRRLRLHREPPSRTPSSPMARSASPCVATAKQVPPLDSVALEAAILGKPEPEAQAVTSTASARPTSGSGPTGQHRPQRSTPAWTSRSPAPVVIESPGTGPSPSPSEDAP